MHINLYVTNLTIFQWHHSGGIHLCHGRPLWPTTIYDICGWTFNSWLVHMNTHNVNWCVWGSVWQIVGMAIKNEHETYYVSKNSCNGFHYSIISNYLCVFAVHACRTYKSWTLQLCENLIPHFHGFYFNWFCLVCKTQICARILLICSVFIQQCVCVCMNCFVSLKCINWNLY